MPLSPSVKRVCGKESVLDIWQHELHLGEQLPNMPLWLRGGLSLPVDLNASYERTCRAHRLDEL